MKVRTDIKAGGVVGQASQKTANLISQAEEQANTLGGNLARTTTSLWNCLAASLQTWQKG